MAFKRKEGGLDSFPLLLPLSYVFFPFNICFHLSVSHFSPSTLFNICLSYMQPGHTSFCVCLFHYVIYLSI